MGRRPNSYYAQPAAEPETVVQPEAAEEIVESKPDAPETVAANTITNPGRYVRRIGLVVLAPGGCYTLTAKDLADEETMGKINYMIKLGVLHAA